MFLRARGSRSPAEVGASLAESLTTVGAAVLAAHGADEALDALTRGLTDLRIGCALFSREEGGLRLERSTLPLRPEVWARPLHLPALAAALSRGQPLFLSEAASAFVERLEDGSSRPLWSGEARGSLLAAPTGEDGQAGLLCLVSERLQSAGRGPVRALALQVGGALRLAELRRRLQEGEGELERRLAERTAAATLLHELTQRLSHSLSGEEILREVFASLRSALGFDAAAAVVCRGNEDVTTIFASAELAEGLAEALSQGALEAFARLAGDGHRGCAKPAFGFVRLATEAEPAEPLSGRLESITDAPLIVGGRVVGLLRVGARRPGAFSPEQDRLFYTSANQASLAMERMDALRQAERLRLESLAESLSDGIILVDGELRITALNAPARQHAAALLGSEPAEGTSLAGTALAELAREALATGRPTAQQDLSSSGPGRRYLVAMAAPLAGSPEGSAAVIVLRDVTEERLMQERLLQSEKMASVGQLVSGVAHELNNPLTGIMGFAQLLLAREQDERTRREVETIYTEAERATKIVQNLLSFARRRHAQKELADLNTLVERVLELRNYDLRVRNIEVELELDPHLPGTMVDPDQIQQVFFNIISNAEQAMLTAHSRGRLTVRSRMEDAVVRVTFQDDGPGILQENLRRIFDPFFTTKQAGEGTGLGLTICYGIIDEHGGRIWAESAPGQGTAFIVELPVVTGEAPSAPPEELEEEARAVPTRTILVVEDEESIQRLLAGLLAMDGHQVDAARNGVEALEKLADRHYDLIITDIKMPEMDGQELYRRLQERDPDLARRTVFITGDTVSTETRRFLERVSNPCLAKPFRIREVRETVERILEERE